MGRPLSTPREVIDRARDLWEAGMSANAVAREIGVHHTTILDWRDRFGWRRGSATGRKLEAIEMFRRGYSAQAIAERVGVHVSTVHYWARNEDWASLSKVESAAALDADAEAAEAKRIEVLRLWREGRVMLDIATATNLPWPRVHLIIFDARRAQRAA